MNYEQLQNNKLYLSGKLVSDPIFSHEVYGEGFYEMFLSVPRLSEQKDILPITLSERLIKDNDLKMGVRVSVFGQFRSYNKIEDGKSRLMLTVFVRDIVEAEQCKNPNIIYLSGYICKPPIYRTTPFAREIADVLLAVNRAYGKSDYIPCIAWGRTARFLKTLSVGEKISVSGRIQSREYQKKISEEISIPKVAYEISLCKISLNDDMGNLEEMIFENDPSSDVFTVQ